MGWSGVTPPAPPNHTRGGGAPPGRPPGPSTNQAEKLAREAAEAAQRRAYQTHPDVVALRVEHVRTQVDRLCWAGITLGLGFTMTNVQAFAAAGAALWSLPWLAAWLLDPTVSLVLLAILRAEQVTARYQVHTGPWVRRAKWLTVAATYVMNTWASFAAGSLPGIVLHSVPPLVVFVAAEAVTDLRDKLTEAVTAAFTNASAANAPQPVHQPKVEEPKRKSPRRRKLFGEYLAEARAAWSPGVEITPAWIRSVTDCARGLSPRLAADLKSEVERTSANNANDANNATPEGEVQQ
ncbi:hypothetical protein [Kutzneria sp. NPDC052558]|uniref:hypothetical protein n=1 Tax=Kutzneria sp. NPDC052558 TaxID=3364121 RepID=UPI0037C53E7A